MPDLLAARVRLHVVTGKGGTGKTTVAAALGVALARRGRRVLLVEVEERQGIARVFDTAPLGYDARPLVRVAGGELLGLSVEAKAALLEYLEVFYRLGRAGRALDRIGAVDFATTIAPGLRDVLLTGKVYDAVRLKRGRRRGDGPYAYDHVVVDAPPTGRIGRFLNVNADVAELARMGPVHSQAAAMTEVFRASSTAVHLVTLLEDMPVQETVDAATELRGLGLPLGGLLVNQVRPTLVDADRLDDVAAGRVDVAALRAGLQEAGVPGRRPKVRAEALAQQAVEHAQRVQREASLRGRLHEVGLPVVELPQLHGGRDGLHHGGVHELADALTAGATTPPPSTTSGAPHATAGRA